MATPLGCGVDTIRKRLIQGDCGIRALCHEDIRINSFDRETQLHAYEQLTSKVAAVVPCRTNLGDFNEDLWLNSKEHRSIARFIGYALCAADEALKDAKWLPTDREEKKRTSHEHEMWILDDTVIDAEIGTFSAALFDDYGGSVRNSRHELKGYLDVLHLDCVQKKLSAGGFILGEIKGLRVTEVLKDKDKFDADLSDPQWIAGTISGIGPAPHKSYRNTYTAPSSRFMQELETLTQRVNEKDNAITELTQRLEEQALLIQILVT
ncbi:hypothetical protein FNV43_RR00697 [Rhamnella rubrinervis]|uniref:beta-ketoacyl-[acyl-carrier-protein] synthase I n=1 Tax=Rhamnella rubrinervis TaxID=2594499 RepID=A0A8K0HPN1_9ROSA|nr:hypothetical protein FNV43_RR00697 [Rhamnella rubrinervis]